MINMRISALACLLVSAMPIRAYGAACDAFVTKWAWFIGGEVTVNRDGTFVQQSGNAGTWECTDPARGRITMRWRDGGFVNSLVVSPDGQNITSTDLSQSYVTARRSISGSIPQPVRKENCCQETFGCETKKIEAEFEQKMAKCHFPGNSGCIADATSTKASRLKAANERLRLCNRMPGSEGTSSGLQAGAAPPPPPANNDEFHSTEGTSGFAQECQPCGFNDPPATSDRTIGQTETPPEPEPPGPFKLGAEENVVIKPPTLDELWEEWAKDYNIQVSAFLSDFTLVIPKVDRNNYTYTADVTVYPDGKIDVGEPGGTFPESKKDVWKKYLPVFKKALQEQVRPRPFPPGSQLAWWRYPVTYVRTKADTPFTPAPTPQEPTPAPPKPRRTTRR